MKSSRTRGIKKRSIAFGFLLFFLFFIYYLYRPITLAETDTPNRFRIVEIPDKDITGFFRDAPKYRFEYIRFDNEIWSAASFRGDSYRAQTAKIESKTAREANFYLDDQIIFKIKDGLFIK